MVNAVQQLRQLHKLEFSANAKQADMVNFTPAAIRASRQI
jgi:hypothetical protein